MTDTEQSGQQEKAVVETPVTEEVKNPVTETPTPVVEEPEKMVPQSKVNEIVGAAKKDASDKAYDKAMHELERKEMAESVQQPPQNVPSDPPPNNDFSKNFEQELQVRLAQAKRIEELQKFRQVIDDGVAKYNDFDNVVGELDFVRNEHLVQFINAYPNAADVAYDLASNPAKFASINLLAQTSPRLAHKEFAKLSKSIESNQEALRQKQAAEPLDQIKPSNTGTDNGLYTVSDLRKNPKLRG